MTRAEIRRRLTGDRGQPLVPLSWWPALDAAMEDPARRIVVLWMTRQSGKTQSLMMRAVEDLLLVPNSFTLFVTPAMQQATTIFHRKLRLPIARLLRAAGLPVSTIRTTQLGAEHPALNAAVEIVAANEATAPSRSVSLLILDEGRYISDDVFGVLAPSVIAAGGKILIASTAGRPSGFFHHLATVEQPEVCVIQVDANENPAADPSIIAFLRGLLGRLLPSVAERDLDNRFVEDGDSFLPSALIETAVDDGLRDIPALTGRAFAFYDLSRTRDLTSRCVLVLVPARRPEQPDHALVASLRIWDPKLSPTNEVDFAEVRADLARLPDRFPGLVSVLVDEGAEAGSLLPFARQHPRLSLLVEGFRASAESNMSLWGALAARLHSRTLSIPRHPRLLAELANLRQESFALGARWRIVDASRRLHRDISLSLAGACYAAAQAVEPARPALVFYSGGINLAAPPAPPPESPAYDDAIDEDAMNDDFALRVRALRAGGSRWPS